MGSEMCIRDRYNTCRFLPGGISHADIPNSERISLRVEQLYQGLAEACICAGYNKSNTLYMAVSEPMQLRVRTHKTPTKYDQKTKREEEQKAETRKRKIDTCDKAQGEKDTKCNATTSNILVLILQPLQSLRQINTPTKSQQGSLHASKQQLHQQHQLQAPDPQGSWPLLTDPLLEPRTNAPTGRVDRNWAKSGGKAP